MKKSLCFLLSATLLLVCLTGCGGGTADSKSSSDNNSKINIQVGIEEPLTGAQASLGNSEYNACLMAIKMINDQGGVMGKYPITYESVDTQSDAAVGASESERLITSKNVPVLFGSYSSAIAASVSEVAERNKVVLWEMSGSADSLLTKGYEWTFRTEAMASNWGATSVDFIQGKADEVKSKLGKDISDLKVAIVHEDGPYGTAVANGNAAEAKAVGMNVVMNEAYSSSAVDLSNVIIKLKKANPDVLLLTSYVNDAILFNRQAKELGFKVPILITHSGGHSVQAFVDGVGSDADFLLTVDPVPCNPKLDAYSEENQKLFEEFDKLWTEKYGTHPYHHVEMRVFAQTMLFFNTVVPKAIEQSGEYTSDSVAKAIRSLDVDAAENLMGFGVQYSTLENPYKDPVLGASHVGQNIKAHAFINQYFDGELSCVYPEDYAQKDAVLFLPSSNPLSANS